MSKCVKTGAKVWFPEMGIITSADIYAVGPATLVVRMAVQPIHKDVWFGEDAVEQGATHTVFECNFDAGSWVRQDLGVAVVMRSHLVGDLCDD